MNEQHRIIIKEGNKWVVRHYDGAITKHKTFKEAKEYEHTVLVFDPFVGE
jgi:hypothetical protein